MPIRIRLSRSSRQLLVERLPQAYRLGQLRVIKRIHALLSIFDGRPLTEVAESLHLSEQTVRSYVSAFLRQGLDSLQYRRPPGRPPRLTQTQRKELAYWITAGRRRRAMPPAVGRRCCCKT